MAWDQGERLCHTQSLIVSDGSDDAEEEIGSEVTHPLKAFFPYTSLFYLRLHGRIGSLSVLYLCGELRVHTTKASVVLGSHCVQFNVS